MEEELETAKLIIEDLRAKVERLEGTRPLHKNVACLYATLIPRLREVAREHGYALALHGTMNRDCDLALIPWVETASDVMTLVKALREASGGFFKNPTCDEVWSDEQLLKEASGMPMGRISFAIHFAHDGGNGPYLDISVTPDVRDYQKNSRPSACGIPDPIP